MICNSNYLSLTPKLLLTHNFWWECHWALKIYTQVLCTLLSLWGKGTQRPPWNPTSPLPQFCLTANQRAGHSPNLDVGGGDNDHPCSSMSSPTVHTGLEIKGCCPSLSSHGTCYHIASREQRVGKTGRITHHNSIKFWQHLTFLCIHHH